MRRRRLVFLWVAILLLAAAVALMLYGEEPAPEPPEVTVNFPRRLSPNERKRMEGRRVLPVPAATDAGVQADRPRDPVLAALSGGGKSAVVVEANAIRNSPVGKLLLDCLLDISRENPIDQLKREAGVDLLQDLDRVAMTDDGVVISGHFANARWDDLFRPRASSDRYGDSATLYRPLAREVTLPDGGRITRQPEESVAVWGDQMLLMGDNDDAVRAMIDRVEGRGAVQPLLGESQTYGEIYGVISAEDLARIFPTDQFELAERFKSAASRIEVHVDTSSDVGIVANVKGTDPSQVEDLGKSMGAALSVARLGAQREEEKELAELLELANVKPDGDSFKLEMAIPLEMLEKQLSRCGERRREREERWRRQQVQRGGADAGG